MFCSIFSDKKKEDYSCLYRTKPFLSSTSTSYRIETITSSLSEKSPLQPSSFSFHEFGLTLTVRYKEIMIKLSSLTVLKETSTKDYRV